jgi:UPF0716 protein FxsA
MLYLFLLFTVVPLLELAALVWIGGQTAWWVPILIVLIDAIAGAALLRWQGWRVMRRIQEDMAARKMPGDALVDGALILVAGVLLVTPGVLTDIVGLALLIPPLRKLVKRGVTTWLRHHVQVQTTRFTTTHSTKAAAGTRPTGQDEIIDARVISTRVEDAN